MKYLFIILTGLFCVEMAAQSPSAKNLFQEAKSLFEQANEVALNNPDSAQQLYLEAARKYQLLVDKGDGATLPIMMNLGNAYFLAGDNGRAMLNYHKASLIDPANENVQHNLNFVRSQCIDELSDNNLMMIIIRKIFFWHYTSLQKRIMLFGIFYIFFWTALALLLFRKSKQIRISAVVALTIATILVASASITYMNSFSSVDGIITTKEAQTYQGDGYIYNSAFTTPLHSGTEFNLKEKRGKWYYIQLTDGKKCWITEQDMKLIR